MADEVARSAVDPDLIGRVGDEMQREMRTALNPDNKGAPAERAEMRAVRLAAVIHALVALKSAESG